MEVRIWDSEQFKLPTNRKEKGVNIYFYDSHQSVSYKNLQSRNTKLRLVNRHTTERYHHTEQALQVLCVRRSADLTLCCRNSYHATV